MNLIQKFAVEEDGNKTPYGQKVLLQETVLSVTTPSTGRGRGLNQGFEKSLSIVVPVYNEQDNVSRLHEEIVQVCTDLGYPFEIIVVDDGSTDRTGEIASSLSPVKYIRLRRNFGQTAALDEGIKSAVIFTHCVKREV